VINARWLASRTLGVLAAPLVLAGVLAGIAPGGASASTCESWTGLQPPNPGSNNSLNGVTVLSSCNAWAVGYYANGGIQSTLIEHWNGSTWRQVSSPNPTDTDSLTAVAATSSTNIWAVGYYVNPFNGTGARTLIEHWNGTAWRQVPSPNAGGPSNSNELTSVAATSSRNAWAVGQYFNGTTYQTLIEHWNGSTWRHVPSPNPGGPGRIHELQAATATSTSNAWAVGFYRSGGIVRTLIEHWNGTSWTHVRSPNPGTVNQLSAVAATSSRNAWAVGQYFNGTTYQTLIEHWNGTAWRHVPSPNAGRPGKPNGLDGVTATSASNAWAVGDYGSGHISRTLIEHWNGTAWKHVPSPNPSSSDHLTAVAAASSTNVWAVGYSINGTAYQTLALHCC
jgi:hypothetical protein